MNTAVDYISRSSLPDYVFPDGKRPAKKKKTKDKKKAADADPASSSPASRDDPEAKRTKLSNELDESALVGAPVALAAAATVADAASPGRAHSPVADGPAAPSLSLTLKTAKK